MTSRKQNLAREFNLTPEMLDEHGLPKLSLVFEQIARDRNINNNQIAGIIHMSPSAVGRLRRGEQTWMEEKNLVEFCREFKLPLRPYLLANAINQLPKSLKEAVAPAVAGNVSALTLGAVFATIPVATHIRVNQAEWEKAVQGGVPVRNLIVDSANLRPASDIVTLPADSWNESFLFRHVGQRMVSRAESERRSIPDGSLVLIKPVDEGSLRDGDLVLVQFFHEPANPAEQPEDAALYSYRRRREQQAEFEEYHSFDPRHQVRIRAPGKFSEKSFTEGRAILGKAVAILYAGLEA